MLSERSERSPARRGLEVAFSIHTTVYVLVNALCLFIWAASGFGYFWPMWVMGPWGFVVGLQAWATWGMRFSRF